jgi:metal-dependent amidase/aminoacylase/carboxypeptidase family protein
MFGLGSGENVPALHNPDYDFPDEIIQAGIDIFYNISKVALDA